MIRGSYWLAAAGMAVALAGCDSVSGISSQPSVAVVDTNASADASVNIGSLSEVISRNPNDPGAYNTRGAAYARVGRYSDAIGDFGLRGNGAAGLEIDRADATLGSPPSLLLLATADRIGYGGLPTPEEFRTTHRGLTGEQNARVRADMTLFPTANGGAVFTTGSIAWVCSLSHNGYENNVSRITGNVLRRFLDPAPLEGFAP